MIVEEVFDNVVNVYVDGFVFTANDTERVWRLGDGDTSDERIASEASRRAMKPTEFSQYYASLCHAAAGWADTRWLYRFNVDAREGSPQ